MKEFYKHAFNGIWSQYLLKVSSRERLEHKFDILLIVSGFLALAFFTLRIWEENILNFIPLGTLALVYSIGLFHIYPRKIWTPWVNKKDFEKYKENDDIESLYQQLVTESQKLTGEIDTIIKRDSKLLKAGVFLLLFSTIFPIFLYLSILYCPYIVLGEFTLIIVLLYIFLKIQ